MKKVLLSVIFGLLIMASPCFSASLEGYGLNSAGSAAGYKPLEAGGGEDYLKTRLTTILQVVLALVATIFFVLTLYAGIRWMIARGNDELSGKARNSLIASVTGLMIVVSSYAITNYILNKLLTTPGDGAKKGCCCTWTGSEKICDDTKLQRDCYDSGLYKKAWDANGTPGNASPGGAGSCTGVPDA